MSVSYLIYKKDDWESNINITKTETTKIIIKVLTAKQQYSGFRGDQR